MLASQRIGTALALLVSDLLVIAASFGGAYWIRFGDWRELIHPGEHRVHHLVLAASLLLAWPLAMWLARYYSIDAFQRRRSLAARLLTLAVPVGIAIAAVLFLVQAKLASRQVFAMALGASTIGLWGVRAGLLTARRALGRRTGIGVVIVGAGAMGCEMGDYLSAHPELGIRLVGYLRRAGDSVDSDHAGLILGDEGDLASILERDVIDQVVIAAPLRELGSCEGTIQLCDEVGIDVSVAATGLGSRSARVSVGELGGRPLLQLSASPQFRAAMVGKRCFDIVCASLLSIAALPVMFLAAVAIKLSSRGPILFVQDRVGLNGRRFPFLKFRTMVVGAHELREGLPNEASGPVFKLRDDPRITSVGGTLRRLSIDELPQLFNVLAGHMSLVGPRPPLPEEIAHYDRWQLRRLSVKPGITCTWQVSGRSEIGFDDWMQLDLAYIDNWSPWLDLKILARTIPAVLSRRGAR